MKKTETIHVRVTPDEKEKIKSLADESGAKVSNYIRKIVLQKKPSFLSREEREELSELRKKAIEITRSLNLYHEQRSTHSMSVKTIKDFVKKLSRRR